MLSLQRSIILKKEKSNFLTVAKKLAKMGCQLELIKILASEVDTVVSVVVNRLQRLHFQKYIKFIHIFHTAFLIRCQINNPSFQLFALPKSCLLMEVDKFLR